MRRPETQFNALTPDNAGQANQAKTSEVQSERLPIAESEMAISYLGVELPKSRGRSSEFVPKREQYADFDNDPDLALPLQRDIAVSFLNGDPMLVEGGTSLGKTTTVRKMCAELGYEVHYINLNGATDVEDLMGRYIPNPHKKSSSDPEYIFADGKVTSGLRQEEKKIKVIIVDEYNSAAPNIAIRMHEVLDALERGGDVVLSEDASEAVRVNKQITKIIALQNPPGKGYLGREPLDPAQLRRWVYKKLPSNLPEGTFSHSIDSLFGFENGEVKVPENAYLASRGEALSPEQLQEIPGLNEVLAKFKEFHKAAKELLKNRKIAADQPQVFSFDDRMEPRRVRDFVLRFYTGDINETFQQALRYYYANKLESDADRKKLEEIIRLVEYKAPAGSKRKGLPNAVKPNASKPERKESATGETSFERAREILHQDFLGPETFHKAFGFEVPAEKLAPIPYTQEELDKAKELGEMLVLRVSIDGDGNQMTMQHITELAQQQYDLDAEGKVLYSTEVDADTKVAGIKDDAWFKDEEFFTSQGLKTEWKLVGKEFVAGSTSNNYIDQTKILRDYLKGVGALSADEEAECTDAALEEIRQVMSDDWQKAAEMLSELLVNQNHRRKPVEVLYDQIMRFKGTNERGVLERNYDWTPVRSSHGVLVYVGRADFKGTHVYDGRPGDSGGFLGVVSVR